MSPAVRMMKGKGNLKIVRAMNASPAISHSKGVFKVLEPMIGGKNYNGDDGGFDAIEYPRDRRNIAVGQINPRQDYQ
jgi:hypothetical protein